MGEEYHVLGDSIKLLAVKTMGYKTVPCLVRDEMKEIFLRKMMKKLMLDEEIFDENNLYKDIKSESTKCRIKRGKVGVYYG